MRITTTKRTRIQWRASQARLSVKELAGALGVSTRYVYQMRANGFEMEWDFQSHCYVASVGQARQWICRTGFRLSNGRPKVDLL